MKVMEFCPHCMCGISVPGQLCPVCGGDLQVQNLPHQLPVNTILHGRYLIGKVLGEGGFGITYVGLDLTLRDKVAIKEYYPSGVGARYATHSTTVETSTRNGAEQLEKGKQRFLEEAQVLARFRSVPSIVTICDFFYENNTGYIIMEYLDGQSLNQWMQEHGPEKDFDTLYQMLRPVMDGLAQVHQAGLIHRDISLSNLMLLKDGTVKLLDFGTARDVSPDGEKSLSVVLKPGFAPVEQYQSHGSQGPWTDVYALCASMYKLLTGDTPETSVDRVLKDNLLPPSQLGAVISRKQEQVLLAGMAVEPGKRLQSMEALCAALDLGSSGHKKSEASGRDKKKNGSKSAESHSGDSSGGKETSPELTAKRHHFFTYCKEVFLEPELLPRAEPGLPDCRPAKAALWTLAILLLTVAIMFSSASIVFENNSSSVFPAIVSRILLFPLWLIIIKSRKNLPQNLPRKVLNLLRWLSVLTVENFLGFHFLSVSDTIIYVLTWQLELRHYLSIYQVNLALMLVSMIYLWFTAWLYCRRSGKKLPAVMALRGLRLLLRTVIITVLFF